jgi:hypothetical protein
MEVLVHDTAVPPDYRLAKAIVSGVRTMPGGASVIEVEFADGTAIGSAPHRSGHTEAARPVSLGLALA